MASYKGNIGLLSLNGAQVFKGIDKDTPRTSVRLHSGRLERNQSGAASAEARPHTGEDACQHLASEREL